MAVARVTASAPEPPIRVLMLLTVPVLPPAARLSLLAPVPRSTAMAVVSAVPRVTVSLPVPPVMVSMLATVAELAKLPNVSVSLPAPRSMEPLAMAAPRVMVSAPVPPMRVLTLFDVSPMLARLPRVSDVELPAPRSTDAAGDVPC